MYKLGKKSSGRIFVPDPKQTHLRVHILSSIPRAVAHTDQHNNIVNDTVSLFGN